MKIKIINEIAFKNLTHQLSKEKAETNIFTCDYVDYVDFCDVCIDCIDGCSVGDCGGGDATC